MRSSRFVFPALQSSFANDFNVDNFFSDEIDPSTYRKSRLHVFNSDSKDPLFEKSGILFPETLEDHPNSFFKSMRILVFVAQFFAVLPVSGAGGPNYKSIKFNRFHYKTLYWILSLAGTIFHFVCFLRHSFLRYSGIYTKAASRLVFFGSSIISSLLMLHLAYNWRNLNEEFAKMEIKFKKYGYPEGITFKFKVFTAVFLTFGLVEYLLLKLTFFEETNRENEKDDNLTVLDSYFKRDYEEVFQFHSYNLAGGILMLVSNFRTSTIWALQDLFLAFVSYTIAERFKQIHHLLERVHGQEMPVKFWKEIREDYNDLTVLTKRVDSYTQNMMFLAMGNDLFFLCMTLFNSLQHKICLLKVLYFFWSFGFQLIRTIFVAFSAARINDESKEPRTVLYSVPQNNYSIEVRRFLTQLTTNEVALTGYGFFSITRNLILTIMGTVLTYEIVLVQFSSNSESSETKNNHTCLF